MSTTNFKYTLAYKTNSREEHDNILKELESIGYVNRTCIIDYNEYPFIITGYIDNNGYGSYPNYATSGREVIDSKELFIALASMRDGDEFFEGEYVLMGEAGGWGYNPDNNGCLAVITGVSRNEDNIQTIGGKVINPNVEYCNSFTKVPHTCYRGQMFRKATKEEIIQHFSKKTMIKEDKTDLIFGKWKVGDVLDIPKQNYKYFCNHWKGGKDMKIEEAEFPNSGSTDIVIKSEVYEGEEYLCFDSHLESTSYFMIPKSELIKNGILTEEKTKTKSQEMNKKFKNKLAVTGSKHLLEAFAKELVELGCEGKDKTSNYDWLNWSEKYPAILIRYKTGIYSYENHTCGADTVLTLPQDWDKALELAKEVEEEKLIEGKWYVVDTQQSKNAVINFQGINNAAFGFSHSGYWTDYYGNSDLWNRLSRYTKTIIKPVTKEEIESLLKAEAKKRGYEEGVKVKDIDNNSTRTLCSNGTYFDLSADCLAMGGVTIYYEGKWAEIIPSTPDITINGYKAEFFDDRVVFGCAKFHKNVFKEVLELHNNMNASGTTNRGIQSITLGTGLFSIEQIKQIVDYYQNK